MLDQELVERFHGPVLARQEVFLVQAVDDIERSHRRVDVDEHRPVGDRIDVVEQLLEQGSHGRLAVASPVGEEPDAKSTTRPS
jgi:hypothetical protein